MVFLRCIGRSPGATKGYVALTDWKIAMDVAPNPWNRELAPQEVKKCVHIVFYRQPLPPLLH